jgi:hypothetical protein
MEPENQAPAQPAATPAPATPPAGALPAETPAQEQTVPYERFKQVNDRLKAIEDERALEAKQRQEADEKKLAQDQEWQKLYESRKAKVEELTPKAELADKLSAMVLEQYTAEIAAWPEQVRNMAPADDADVLSKLDWMKKAKPLAVELMADKTPVPGNGRRPTPAGAVNTSKAAEKELTDWRKSAAARYR